MVLSVCIPVYNTSVLALVEVLRSQAAVLEELVEIIILDDGSAPEFREINSSLQGVEGIKYFEQDNMGRAATRNRLAELASGDYLLFVDSDCMVPEGFLRRYLKHCKSDCVVVGGIAYSPRPEDHKLMLRWKVGVKREQRSIEERRAKPYLSFLSSNFMISRSLFSDNRFNSALRNYGHEDTLFGNGLFIQGLQIRHIDNPVIHTGLDTADLYLMKIEESIGNLLYIWAQGFDYRPFRILVAFRRLRTFGLAGVFAVLFCVFKKPIRRLLTGFCTSLFLLDIYKLGLFCLAYRQAKKIRAGR